LALAAIIAIANCDLNAAGFISRGVEGVGEKSKESDAWIECSMGIVIASEAKQSMTCPGAKWIASSRSLSSGAHSRDPLAPRNDGLRLPSE
jgi:hypothetical protein